MGKGYLIDTNAIIDYISGSHPDTGLDFIDTAINEGINISIVNKIEALSFTPQSEIQVKYFNLIVEFVNEANVLDLNNEIVHQTIEFRRSYKIKLPDAIIAASAFANQLALLTRNLKDFERIKGLEVINPYDIN